jgi:RimJ/RimL family protein N-acetyltransferase
VTLALRPAIPEDVPYLARLLLREEIAPFLAAARASTEEEVAAQVAHSLAEPDVFGVLVFVVDGERVGTATWEQVNRRSRIATVSGFAIDPARQGQGLGTSAAIALQRYLLGELGFHRIQMEIYGFNERALRHAVRAGWVREGVRRRAYSRGGDWVDGVLFGMVVEDLDDGRRGPPEPQEP